MVVGAGRYGTLYVVIRKTPLKEKAGNDWLFP